MVTARPCKIRIVKELTDIWPQYQPKVGRVYHAEYIESGYKRSPRPPICVVTIQGKRITVRRNEFEILG